MTVSQTSLVFDDFDVLRSTSWVFCRKVWFSLTSFKNFSCILSCVCVVWNWYVQLCFLLSFFFSWLVFSEIPGLVSVINFEKFLAIIISNISLLCSSFLFADIPIMYTLHLLLLTKVCLVKATVFPVVMYRCESWTMKKAETKELMLSNGGAGEDSWESLGLQGDPTSPS